MGSGLFDRKESFIHESDYTAVHICWEKMLS